METVTATDGRLFQAPFRAGIHLKDYQLTPLMKALELPRANLFIADDVGLGKTIEAGLVLQEMLLRQRIDFILVLCPAAVTAQWKMEMETRFGLRFEIYDRELVSRRRQERGFGVNPWLTHGRFIASYQTFRRPEHFEALRATFPKEGRRSRSMLVLDEAHTVAPASASRWAVDSALTEAVRSLAPLFEHRLFLSATPHNGHSNSFSALLELLDPQRFLRGERVTDPARLAPVMVRRLKTDLPDTSGFPKRIVRAVEVRGTFEEELSEKLTEYTALAAPQKGRARLAFVTLQKRLLSSVYAFASTLEKHAARVASATAEEDDGDDEKAEAHDLREESLLANASKDLPEATGRVKELLVEMRALAQANRLAPDAKLQALVLWIREHQCSGVALGGGKKAPWSDERVIIFTEYGHTKDYLVSLLRTAVAGTDRGDDRIAVFDGGMSDDERRELGQAFNAPPRANPMRILICTDAAREVNLQGACKTLFHFDVPWNPARMEQRNGRIDRTLQPAKEVTCAYFVYPRRREDRVLRTLVEKVERIRTELGSLGAVVAERYATRLAKEGISDATQAALDGDQKQAAMFHEPVGAELESVRKGANVRLEIEEARKRLQESGRKLNVGGDLLRDVLGVALRLAGAGPMTAAPSPEEEPNLACFTVPALSEAWERSLDALRPLREKDEPPWEWRKRPLLPVCFVAPERLATPVVHLHLSHPFVQRLLSRFLAQGFSAHDLSRVAVLADPRPGRVRVVSLGRLGLFGAGASRLHEEILRVGGAWNEAIGTVEVFPPGSTDERELERDLPDLLRAPKEATLPVAARARIVASASSMFASLWREVEKDAEARGNDAKEALGRRGTNEAEALRKILHAQLEHAGRLLEGQQLTLGFEEEKLSPFEKAQVQKDRSWLRERRDALRDEEKREPALIEQSYAVALTRVEPVALIVLWPRTAS